MFYLNGKLYYTRTGQSALYWRWFAPDSGVTGCRRVHRDRQRLHRDGVLFISGGNLYWSKTDGKLYRIGWTGTGFTGTATAISGPAIDSRDWRSTRARSSATDGSAQP